jgi:hypothetical protein
MNIIASTRLTRARNAHRCDWGRNFSLRGARVARAPVAPLPRKPFMRGQRFERFLLRRAAEIGSIDAAQGWLARASLPELKVNQ